MNEITVTYPSKFIVKSAIKTREIKIPFVKLNFNFSKGRQNGFISHPPKIALEVSLKSEERLSMFKFLLKECQLFDVKFDDRDYKGCIITTIEDKTVKLEALRLIVKTDDIL